MELRSSPSNIKLDNKSSILPDHSTEDSNSVTSKSKKIELSKKLGFDSNEVLGTDASSLDSSEEESVKLDSSDEERSVNSSVCEVFDGIINENEILKELDRNNSQPKRAWLRAIIPNIIFLCDLDPNAVEELVNAFEFKDIKRKEQVIVQGKENNKFYLVFSGRLLVFKTKSNVTNLVKIFQSENFFGELALKINEKNAITVIAKTDCNLAVLVCFLLLVYMRTHTVSSKYNEICCRNAMNIEHRREH